MRDRQEYLIRFLRGCAHAADENQLHVDLGRLLVNGDLMREAADEFEKLLPEVHNTKTEKLRHHLYKAERHAYSAYTLLFEEGAPKRSIWFRMAVGSIQSKLMTLYVRELRKEK